MRVTFITDGPRMLMILSHAQFYNRRLIKKPKECVFSHLCEWVLERLTFSLITLPLLISKPDMKVL
jgi:hypothetical protein